MRFYEPTSDITFTAGTTRVEVVARMVANHRIHIPPGLEVTTAGKRTSGGTSVFKGRFTGYSPVAHASTYEVTGEPQITPYPCEAVASPEVIGDLP